MDPWLGSGGLGDPGEQAGKLSDDFVGGGQDFVALLAVAFWVAYEVATALFA